MGKRWFDPRSNSKILGCLILAIALAGACLALSVEHFIGRVSISAASPLFQSEIPDDDGVPATLAQAKLWVGISRLTHEMALLLPYNANRERYNGDANWHKMWAIRYKKIQQRLDFVPESD